MPLIALLFLFQLAYAKDADSCNTSELERKCFSSMCRSRNSSFFPTDERQLQQEIASSFSGIPLNIQQTLEAILTHQASLRQKLSEYTSIERISAMVDSIIANPIEHRKGIDGFFDGQYSCWPEANGVCGLISSSMEPTTIEAAHFFRDFHTYLYFYDQSRKLTAEETPGVVQEMFNRLIEFYSTKDAGKVKILERQFKRISKKKFVETELALLRSEKFINDYLAMTRSRLLTYREGLINAMRIRAQARLSDTPLNESTFLEACKTSSYLAGKLSTVDLQKSFASALQDLLSAVDARILPLLSEHSASVIRASMRSRAIFSLMPLDSIYPSTEIATDLASSLSRGVTGVPDILSGFGDLRRIQNFRCNVSAFVASDRFDPLRGVLISPYSIATGGREILAHEFGHWLSIKGSRLFSEHSKAKYSKFRDCIRSFYSTNTSDREEEDAADWIAARMGWGETRVACDSNALLTFTFGLRNTYEWLPASGASHSRALFREVHMQMVKGLPIPPSCIELASSYPEASPRMCEF